MLSRFKLQPDKWRVRHPKLWASLIGAVVLFFVAVAVYMTIFVQSTNPQPRPTPPPSLAPQKLTQSNYQQTRQAFGPWLLANPGSTGAPHLVMLLSNGAVDVSSAVVHVRNSWGRVAATEIVSVEHTTGHGLRISTGDNHIYDLKFGQAFVLEQRPEVVYGYLNLSGNAILMAKSVKAVAKGFPGPSGR